MAKRKHLVHLAGAALGVVWGAPLLAAPPEENDKAAAEVGLAEIVVTAQKREERLQDVPIAISAIGSDYLKARDISSIEALGTIAPNVKIERAPTNKTVSQIAMRGSVTVNPSVLFEPAVGLYVDGVYIAKAQGSIFDVADLERVEPRQRRFDGRLGRIAAVDTYQRSDGEDHQNDHFERKQRLLEPRRYLDAPRPKDRQGPGRDRAHRPGGRLGGRSPDPRRS